MYFSSVYCIHSSITTITYIFVFRLWTAFNLLVQLLVQYRPLLGWSVYMNVFAVFFNLNFFGSEPYRLVYCQIVTIFAHLTLTSQIVRCITATYRAVVYVS